MISFAIVAHQQRIIEATDLARALDAVASVDDGTAGAEANHLKAWQLTTAIDTEWAAVLEDDATPVVGFLEQAEQALAHAPTPIVSFYLGRSRPAYWQPAIHRALERTDETGACWITSTHCLHAVAVAMRTEIRNDWLKWAPDSALPSDERLTAWAKTRGHRIAYTIPSLVDHADWPTLVAHRDRQPRTESRIAWRVGTRDTWTSNTVNL